MSDIARKVDIVTLLCENRTSPVGHAMISLLDICIQEVREENDSASIGQIPVNQGRIEAYKQIRAYLLSGYAILQETKVKTY